MDINEQLILSLFEAQKEHIDTRFAEVKERVKDLKEDVCDLKKARKKQLYVAGITGLIGGALVAALNFITGGGIFGVIPKP